MGLVELPQLHAPNLAAHLHAMSPDTAVEAVTTLKATIEQINRVTMRGVTEDLSREFHEQVVFVSPDFTHKVQGRDACLATYRDFASLADVQEFKPGDPDVQVVTDTAVAPPPFDIRYPMK